MQLPPFIFADDLAESSLIRSVNVLVVRFYLELSPISIRISTL